MDRERALDELKARVVDPEKIRHCLAVEAIMRELAKYMHEKIEIWGLTGLLHDIDLDIVEGDLKKHGLVAAEILEGLDVDPAVIYSVKSHNPQLGFQRRRKVDKALYCSDHLPGFIQKCASSIPGKKVSDLTVEYLVKKFNEDGFAEKEHKEQISTCSELGLSLEEFFKIGLRALKNF